MRFKDKVCLVSGGGSGIGKVTCLRLAREGGRVAVLDIDDDGTATAQQINESGGEAIFVKTDVSKSEQVQAAVKAAVDKWQRIHVVVNDAAMMTFRPVVELPDEDWDKVLGVNLRSVFLLCKYA
ncbi:MAG: SDR family oxidoreductase, partial [Acidobacteria bacterium]|nr:SDR family oxidoreductase [Acidobacteriota bacterium]